MINLNKFHCLNNWADVQPILSEKIAVPVYISNELASHLSDGRMHRMHFKVKRLVLDMHKVMKWANESPVYFTTALCFVWELELINGMGWTNKNLRLKRLTCGEHNAKRGGDSTPILIIYLDSESEKSWEIKL